MLQSISPYELLRASIPKSVIEKSKTSDQISMQRSSHGSPDIVSAFDAAEENQSSHPSSTRSAFSHTTPDTPKTHYISDIRRRHDSAVKKTLIP